MNPVVLGLSIALIVFCVLLIIVVAVQTKRGTGMSGAVTGQSNYNTAAKKDGKDAFLKRLTVGTSIILAVLVVVLDMALYMNW